jgi:hypothetical protein
MKKLLHLLASCCVLGLGCGKPSTVITGANGDRIVMDRDGGNIRIHSASGDMRIAAGGINVSVPSLFPKDVPMYKGHVVVATQSGDAFQVMVETQDEPEAAFGFYSKRLASNGWKIESETRSDNLVTLTAVKNGRSCSVVASRFQDEGDQTTTIQVNVSAQE